MPKVNYSSFEGLSPKQQAWLNAYFDSGNPRSYMNATGAARVAGYKDKRPNTLEVTGCQNVIKLKGFIRQRMDDLELSSEALDAKMIEGMDAMEVKVFAGRDEDGATELIYSVPLVNWSARRAFLDMANKIQGRYAADKIQIEEDTGELDQVPTDVLIKLAKAITKGKK